MDKKKKHPELEELSQEGHKTLSQKANQRLRKTMDLMQISYQTGSTTEIFFSRQLLFVCVWGVISPSTVRARDGTQVVKFT